MLLSAEAAIHALEVEEPADLSSTPDAAQAALAAEVKAR
jgi:CPA1 family monovalent cation:H+ antiporter